MELNRGNFEANKYFLEKYNLLSKSDKILELGSGLANMLNFLKKKGFKVEGTELNPDHIDFAKKKFKINLKKVDSEILPYKNKSFDKILSFDVFEHIPNSDLHLQEISRVLKKDGVYIFSTPNKVLDVPFEIYAFKSFTKYKKHHCSLQSYLGLKKLLKKNGFFCQFYQVPVKTDFMMNKAQKYLGSFFYKVLKFLPLDNLPIFMKTNFYVVARKLY